MLTDIGRADGNWLRSHREVRIVQAASQILPQETLSHAPQLRLALFNLRNLCNLQLVATMNRSAEQAAQG